MEIIQYSVYWINLDPVIESEVRKTRPCVIVSPNEMNKYLRTVIITPLTHTLKTYPSRVACKIAGEDGMIMLDQIKTADKARLIKYIGKLKPLEINQVKDVLNKMFC